MKKRFDRFEGIDTETYCWGCLKFFDEKDIKYKLSPRLDINYKPLYICNDCLTFINEHTEYKSFRMNDITKLKELIPDD